MFGFGHILLERRIRKIYDRLGPSSLEDFGKELVKEILTVYTMEKAHNDGTINRLPNLNFSHGGMTSEDVYRWLCVLFGGISPGDLGAATKISERVTGMIALKAFKEVFATALYRYRSNQKTNYYGILRFCSDLSHNSIKRFCGDYPENNVDLLNLIRRADADSSASAMIDYDSTVPIHRQHSDVLQEILGEKRIFPELFLPHTATAHFRNL